MQGIIIVLASCFLSCYAYPQPRVAGEVVPDPVAPWACMVLVIREGMEGTAALGGGSIISANRVLTAAHLVRGGLEYRVGWITSAGSRRMFTSTFAVIHEDYDPTDFFADIALIFLQGTNTFPSGNFIRIVPQADEPPTGDGRLIAFGFTSPDSTDAATDPSEAVQTIQACTDAEFTSSDSHFCGVDSTSATAICPGDNGAGLVIPDADGEILAGVASRIVAGCDPASGLETGFTNVAQFGTWIRNLSGIAGQQLLAEFLASKNKN